MFSILTVLFILVSVVFAPNVVDNFWFPKDCLFLIGGFILISYNLISNKGRISNFKNIWLGSILIYTIISFGWYFLTPILLAKEGQKILWNIWNFLPTLNVILAVLLIKDLVEYTDNLNKWVFMAKVLCWVGFSFSIYAIVQYLGLDQIFTRDLKWIIWTKSSHMITFMGNSMHSANFIAMLSPLCLMFKDLRYKTFYLISFIALLLINSAISMIGFIFGFALYLICMRRFKSLLILSSLLIVSGVFVYLYQPQYYSLSGRGELWKIILSGWKDRAITGWGLGGFAIKKYADITTSVALAAENDYLQILHDGGLIMITLVCGYLVNLFKRIIMTDSSMLITGYAISFSVYLLIGAGSFIISIAPLALTGIIYISALETQVK